MANGHSVMLCFFSCRIWHTRLQGDWSSDVCSSDLPSCWGRVGAEKTASNQARTGGWKRWRGSVGMVIDFRDHSAPRDFSVLNHSPSFLFVRGCECAMWKGDRGQTGLTANFRQSAPEIHVSLVSPLDGGRGRWNEANLG